jgi:alkaline phosphatase
MAYVDGFVLAVPKKNKRAYVKMAKAGARVWKKHGALEYRECWGDDLNSGFALSFTKLARLKKGETAVFSYIVYRSKADRNRIIKKVMADPSMGDFSGAMPFDMKRMAYGGFASVVS